jgi:hypothetical protein
MTGERIGKRRLQELGDVMTERDRSVLEHIGWLRYMTGRQVETMLFAGDGSQDSAGRAARRVLQRLTDAHLILRLERRIGGARAGSASFVYTVSAAGQRLLSLDGARKRFREPTYEFLRHTLSITQLVVDLAGAEQTGQIEQLDVETEPRSWRRTTTSSTALADLRPDLFVSLVAADFDYRWFVEVDLGTEHLPRLLQKCKSYERYYSTGIEQDLHGVFPRVLWLMHTNHRADRLGRAIERAGLFSPGLFTVSTPGRAVHVLRGGNP